MCKQDVENYFAMNSCVASWWSSSGAYPTLGRNLAVPLGPMGSSGRGVLSPLASLPDTHIRSFSDFWILLECVRTRVVYYEFPKEIPERRINGRGWHVRRPDGVLLTYVEYMAVDFQCVAVTGAGFNLVFNLEAMSVVSDRCMCCEATYHLDSEGWGVSGVFEPCTAIKVGWFHAFSPGVVFPRRGPPGI